MMTVFVWSLAWLSAFLVIGLAVFFVWLNDKYGSKK